MKTITGMYTWSISVEVEVPDNATDKQQREALDNEALKAALYRKPFVLHECSNPNLID